MEIKDDGLPIHTDATLKIRPRILLEGNFFVDIVAGLAPTRRCSTATTTRSRSTQTAQPVQLGEILNVLKSDVRGDLRTLLAEYSLKGLGGRRCGVLQPRHSASSRAPTAAPRRSTTPSLGHAAHQGRAAPAPGPAADVPPRSPSTRASLKDLVTNLNITAGALASEDVALQASMPALRDTLRARVSRRWPRSTTPCRRCAPSPWRRFPACARRRPRRSTRHCPSSARPACWWARPSFRARPPSCGARSPTWCASTPA